MLQSSLLNHNIHEVLGIIKKKDLYFLRRLCNICSQDHLYQCTRYDKDINKLDEFINQLLDRTILAFLQDLVTRLADAQATKHTAMPDLNVKFLTCHTRHRTPRILRHGHIAMLLVACEMDLIQLRRHGFNIRRDKG